MGGCAKQTFTQVNQASFDCLKQKALSIGITITSNQGQDSKNGVTIAWAFDPNAQTLDLTCLEKPFYAPCGTVNSKIHDLVDSCLQPIAA
jgi:hypothetical protein